MSEILSEALPSALEKIHGALPTQEETKTNRKTKNNVEPMLWYVEMWYDLARFTAFGSFVLACVCVFAIIFSSKLGLSNHAVTELKGIGISFGLYSAGTKFANILASAIGKAKGSA